MKRVMIAVSLLVSVGTARADAEQQCPCESASGHRSYVQCVARVAKMAAKGGSLPKTCRADVMKCVKQSTCGRPGTVVCCESRRNRCLIVSAATCPSGTRESCAPVTACAATSCRFAGVCAAGG